MNRERGHEDLPQCRKKRQNTIWSSERGGEQLKDNGWKRKPRVNLATEMLCTQWSLSSYCNVMIKVAVKVILGPYP